MLTWLVYTLAFLIGLVQTPLFVDLLRLLLPEWNIKRFTSQTASTLLIILMVVFGLTGLVLQMFYFVPLFPNVPFRNFKIGCHSLFAYFVWGNMAVNYCKAVFTHAGSVSALETETEKQQVVTKREQSEPSNTTPSDVPAQVEVAIGTHKHCYCNKCEAMILYMDHHCPFTGNCAGLNTYCHFFLTLLYGSIGLGYSLLVSCLYFGEGIFPSAWNWLQLSSVDKFTLETIEPFVDLFLPALGGFVVVNVILGFHVFLLLSNMTTYEVLNNFWKVPIFKIGHQRILEKEYLKKDSRLNMLLLSKPRTLLLFGF